MGIFTIMYETEIAQKIDDAVANAMDNEVKSAALKAIEESANERIYNAYSPKFNNRRYSFITDGAYKPFPSGNMLTITAIQGMQNLWGGESSADLGDVIATGASNYNMPFARPWMEESAQEHLAELEQALAAGMKRQGF